MTLVIIIFWSVFAFISGAMAAERIVPWVELKLAAEAALLANILERQLKKFQISNFKFQILNLKSQILNLKFQVLAGSACMALLTFLLVPSWALKFLLALPSAWLGWHIPRWIYSYLLRHRLRKFEGQFVDGLTLIANAIRSGLSLQQAFEMASIEMPPPFGEDLANLLADIRLGASFEDALRNMEGRIGLEDLKMVVQSICILRETGGNIIETFQSVTSTIRERQKVHGKIRVMTTQGVVQGAIIFCMPFALSAALYLLAPDFIMPLF